MSKAPSPKERHRVGVFRRCGHVCYAQGRGGCAGRLQAAHWISVQTLKGRQANYRIAIRNGRELPEAAQYLVDMPIDGLIADPRNGVPLCEHHHSSFDKRNGQELILQPPAEVIEFAEEYDLADLLTFPLEAVRW